MSSVAGEYDLFFWAMVAVCGLVTAGIAVCLVYFAVRYRRRSENELPSQFDYNLPVEMTWIVLPFVFFMGMFAAGAKIFFDIERPPDNTLDIYVVAKQWMWKTQHPEGQREINELHVPINRPVKLIMTSQDVIHSFYIPDYRIKQDVLPNRYTTIWFEATTPGQSHLFCAEYCGTNHSKMTGWVYAMTPGDYQTWLEQGAAEGSLASTGEKLFHQYACANCHHFDGHGFCPNLQGLYLRPVRIAGGDSVAGPTTVVADESYIRESILEPKAKIVEGFKDFMPSFKDRLSEEQVIDLIAYIKSIGPAPGSQMQSSATGGIPPETGTSPGVARPRATSQPSSDIAEPH